jgi:hypothetical protein
MAITKEIAVRKKQRVAPSHSVDPMHKDDQWVLEMVQSIWDKWENMDINSFRKGQERYNNNKLYSLGKQTNDIYKPWFRGDQDEDTSFMNLDWRTPGIIPKFRRIMNNKIAKRDFKVRAQAIDAFAREDRDKYEREEWAKIKMREVLRQLGMDDSALNSNEIDQPMDLESLAIKMQFGYQHNQALDIEMRIDAVFEEHRLHQSKLPRIRDYMFNTDIGAVKTWTDPQTGRVWFRVCDPGSMIVSYSEDPGFYEYEWAGEVIPMTVRQVRKMSGGKISEEQLKGVASSYMGIYGNPRAFVTGANGQHDYDDCIVPVLDIEFRTKDTYRYEKRITSKGAPVFGKVPKEEYGKHKDRQYYEDERDMIYGAYWVVDTDLLFNAGPVNDLPIKPGKASHACGSYIIEACEMNGMETNPLCEQLIPSVNQIVLIWMKIQQFIGLLRPKGIAVEIGSLENVNLAGQAGETMKPIELIDMFEQRGIMVYRQIDPSGQMGQRKPIEELSNGMGRELTELWGSLNSHFQFMRDMLGFNDITDGSSPDPKTLNGVASMAAESSNNALYQLFQREQSLIERLADNIAIRVHDSIAYYPTSPYKKLFAPGMTKSIAENRQKTHREYGIVLEYSPTEADAQDLMINMKQAQANKEITMADYYAVKNIKNPRQAEMVLAYRIEKNRKLRMEEAQQMTQQNAAVQQQAAITAEEEKRKTAMLEEEEKRKTVAVTKQWDLAILEKKYALEAGNTTIKKDGDRDVAQIKSDAMERIATSKLTAVPA